MDNIIQIRDLTFAYAAGDEPVLSDQPEDIRAEYIYMGKKPTS